jgi:hypothetical protein
MKKRLTPEGMRMLIDCHECVMRGTTACEDCIVTFLLDRAGDPVELNRSEAEALGNLADAGLVAPLRLVPRHDPPSAAAAG